MFFDRAELKNRHDGSKYNLRTIEIQLAQKIKNNEPWPKFTSSYKKKRALNKKRFEKLYMHNTRFFFIRTIL